MTALSTDSADITRYRRDLDGLRGVAIFLVVFHHYVNAALKPASGSVVYYLMIPGRLAWTGVDLFFILSGYLVGGTLIANRNSPVFFRTFYVRRACRIFPLYFAVVAAFYVLNERVWGIPRPRLLEYLTLAQNFWMAAANNFGVMTLAVTWSLAIEEQFYLAIPFVVRAVEPRRLWWIIVACLALAPLLRLVLFVTLANGYFASHVLFFTRMDTLAFGVLIALVRHRGIVLSERVLYLAWFVLAVAMLFVAWKERSPNLLFRILCYDVFAMFYSVTLLLVLQRGFRALRMKPIVYLGIISYGVYLLHQPINRLLRHGNVVFGNARDVAVTGGAFVVVLLIASMSWELFEKKFVRAGHRLHY
jgi:peptidoglycan/LPS O-acetylase OafA/YrhL